MSGGHELRAGLLAFGKGLRPAATRAAPGQVWITAFTVALVVATAALPAAAARSIDATCPPTATPVTAYLDRGGGQQARSIDCVVAFGVAQGKTSTLFGTRDRAERAQMAQFVVRVLNLLPGYTAPAVRDAFPDDEGSLHESAINEAAAAGIVVGGSDGKFRPSEAVTRGQVASFLARSLRAAGVALPADAPNAFDDDAGSAHERDIDMLAADAVDLVDGYADRTYRPSALVTRGETAMLLARALALLGDRGLLAPISPRPPPRGISSSLVDYVRLPGDQLVVVPDGVYTGGEVVAPHPPTGGQHRGWLILVAETPGRVIIDLAHAPLALLPGTSRVMFVGFEFVNGPINHEGANDIAYWYTEHTYPIEVWAAEYRASGDDLSNLVHRVPRTIRVRRSARISFYGSDFHDIGDDAISGNSTEDLHLEGVRIWNIDEKGYDPGYGGNNDKGDLFHNDAIGTTGGLDRLTIRDSYIGQRLYLGAENGSIGRVTFQNVWSTNSKSAGVIFNSQDGNRITGTRTDIRSWGHLGRGNIDRLDIVAGVHYRPNARPAAIDVRDVGIDREPPPPGAVDPAVQWRAQHPFGTWISRMT